MHDTCLKIATDFTTTLLGLPWVTCEIIVFCWTNYVSKKYLMEVHVTMMKSHDLQAKFNQCESHGLK